MSVQPEHHTRPVITLYMLEGCSLCEKAHEFLCSHRVEFRVKDIDMDEGAFEELLALSGSYAAVPFIWIEDAPRGHSFGITRFVETDVEAMLAQEGLLSK